MSLKSIDIAPKYTLRAVLLDFYTTSYNELKEIEEIAIKDPNVVCFSFEIWEYSNNEISYWISLEYRVLFPFEYVEGEILTEEKIAFIQKVKKEIEEVKGLSNYKPPLNNPYKLEGVTVSRWKEDKPFTPIKATLKGNIIDNPPTLKSIDIAKVNRLSLKDVKLPAQEVKAQPLQVERPPTDAEIAFNKTALNNPVLKAIAERLDLKILRVIKLLDEEGRYTKREAIDQIKEKVGGGLISKQKAERIFNKMLDKGTIKETEVKDYYSVLVSNENKVI
jgi:hypothetical protein